MYDSHVILSCYYRTSVDRDYKKMTEQDCRTRQLKVQGNYKFGLLRDIVIGPNGELVIVDNSNKCVIVLDDRSDRMKLLKVIGQDSGNSRLVDPDAVAVIDNIIAVSDWDRHQVKKYSLQGELLSIIGCYGNNNGQFSCPRGLVFNNNKMLYVIDGDNYRVQVFQQDDTFAFSFGSKGSNLGQFQYPVRIAIDPNKNVLVTDYNAHCIHQFSHSGEFIQKIRCHNPRSITVSPTGYLITGHHGNDNKIKVWSPTYQLINQFGRKGTKQGEFINIYGMDMDSSGAIYVLEEGNERLQIISNT